ncbi:MAG: response regulator, partial [Acidobacteria bacterium]|nr:response regulator [Acidobacteriota bacterium]
QRFHPPQQDVEPVPAHVSASAPTRIVCVIDDLFFLAKVQETARKLNVKVDFVKSDKELLERATSNGHEQPSLIIVDLNNTGAKPLTTIPKLKSKLKGTSIIGFLSHIQGELKVKAQEAGFDAVMPRSALSQNLAQILRRHGAPEDQESEQ